ncbi:hypothetical protein PS941_01091 [Pseudomonas fluorescens]|uniref:HPt domain-containing protein n=1 Tax=Pseudomonas fluorescens TaxID=294 RepID=A0A5E7SFP2_PSEFL|nr:hypothetical protein PS941_01091 [Pseudomonas fluorescens]
MLAGLPRDKRRPLLRNIVLTNQQDLAALDHALAHSDHVGLAHLAHKLKTSAQMMHSDALLRLCETLENSAAEHAALSVLAAQCEAIASLVNDLNDALTATLDAP